MEKYSLLIDKIIREHGSDSASVLFEAFEQAEDQTAWVAALIGFSVTQEMLRRYRVQEPQRIQA